MTAHVDLDDLPAVDQRRVAVRITPDALRQVRGGHPWVFEGSVITVSHDADPGSLAVIFDARRNFAAIGLWDPTSPIRIRILHVGSPQPIDDRFWADRLVAALDRRQTLLDDPRTTGYRCVHGENDGFPGLVIDRYGDTAVMKVYSAAWHPHLAAVVDALVSLVDVQCVVLRHSRSVLAPDHPLPTTSIVVGDAPGGPVPFLERGLRFDADVLVGQKTGHFLDQRENRVLVGGLTAGARVLDVFCCTGGFSVHAAAGGARSVYSVDRSQPALDATRRNMAHNTGLAAVRSCRHETIAGDAFEVLARLADEGRQYDVVVIDPPSFASRAAQVERAVSAYTRLSVLGVSVLAPDGMLVQSSCSSRVDERRFHAAVLEAAGTTGRSVEEWARTGHAVDHPIAFPEGRYLKTVFARVGR